MYRMVEAPLRQVRAAALVIVGFLLMVGTSAHAVVIDGIPLPTGATFVTETIFEDIVTGLGQSLAGVFRITEINDGNGNPVWSAGQGGLFLTGTFTGFTSSFVLPPGSNHDGYVEFAGGTKNIYLQTSNPNISSQGTRAVDLAAATSGTLFLSAQAAPFVTGSAVQVAGGPFITTLEEVIPANSALQSFSDAFGSAFFDVVGGDAALAFHTCSFTVTNPGTTCSPNLIDLLFTESFSSVASGDWPVSGTGSEKALTAVPEPSSLILLAAALTAFAAWRSGIAVGRHKLSPRGFGPSRYGGSVTAEGPGPACLLSSDGGVVGQLREMPGNEVCAGRNSEAHVNAGITVGVTNRRTGSPCCSVLLNQARDTRPTTPFAAMAFDIE